MFQFLRYIPYKVMFSVLSSSSFTFIFYCLLFFLLSFLFLLFFCFCYIPVFLQLLQVDALRTVYFIFSSANCLSQPHVIQVSIFILFCWNSTVCMCVKSELRLQNLILGLTPLSIHH